MKKYYLHNGKEQHGPYSIEELKEQSVIRETLIWAEGMADWTKAGDLDEFQGYFPAIPPPLKSSSSKSKIVIDNSQVQPKTNWRRISYIVGIAILLYFGFSIYDKIQRQDRYNNSNAFGDSNSTIFELEKTPAELRQELVKKEQTAPTDYLIRNGTFRKNLIGEFELEGTIENTASVAVFKDIVLEVDWMSSTGTKINTQYFTTYEIIGPAQKTNYKIKSFAPNGTEKPATGVFNAIAVE